MKICGHKFGPQSRISKIRSLLYVFTEQGVAMLATIILFKIDEKIFVIFSPTTIYSIL